MKLDKPELYENTIGKMEDNLTVLEEKTSWQEYLDDIIDPVMNLEIENVNTIDVKKIVGVLLTNAFETTSPGKNLLNCRVCILSLILGNSFSTSGTVGLFYEPAMMNHQCVANTRLEMEMR